MISLKRGNTTPNSRSHPFPFSGFSYPARRDGPRAAAAAAALVHSGRRQQARGRRRREAATTTAVARRPYRRGCSAAASAGRRGGALPLLYLRDRSCRVVHTRQWGSSASSRPTAFTATRSSSVAAPKGPPTAGQQQASLRLCSSVALCFFG